MRMYCTFPIRESQEILSTVQLYSETDGPWWYWQDSLLIKLCADTGVYIFGANPAGPVAPRF